VTQERIAEARCRIDMARLLTLKAAWMMDTVGNKVAHRDRDDQGGGASWPAT
jgi:acyl-CoA dehydrogenase